MSVANDRITIAFFGRRNAGKSSLVNAVTSQALSVVSDVPGTTTDPVRKAMELLPIGPVMIIDTPGFDDVGDLGELRVEKAREVLAKTDIAVFVTESDTDGAFIAELEAKKLPYIIVHSKADKLDSVPEADEKNIWVSAADGTNINELKERLASLAKQCESTKRIVGDMLDEGDIVLLVTPIDEAAPKGRLILPQQQTIRDILDCDCTAIVCQPSQLGAMLEKITPKMVITDSQAFKKVSSTVPKNIPLTSFSILFARYKGDLYEQVKGAAMLSRLKDGDRVLISEGCTHHRQCGDIGTVKLPAWIGSFSGAKVEFEFTSGGEFPKDLSKYRLIVHCGGCMLNEAQMKHRIATAKAAGAAIVNYGVAIAHVNGILKRSLELFPEVMKILD